MARPLAGLAVASPIVPDRAQDGTPATLCVGCGLCCDGTLFSSAAVEEAELPPLRAVGATFVVRGETTSLTQPCAAFASGCCAIYESRPSLCAAYRCKLLRRHEGGEIPFDVAAAIIADAIARRDRLRPALEAFVGAAPRSSFARLYELLHERFDAAADPAAERRTHAPLALEVAALKVLLAGQFELERDEKKGDERAGGEGTGPAS